MEFMLIQVVNPHRKWTLPPIVIVFYPYRMMYVNTPGQISHTVSYSNFINTKHRN
jgi:hypothetical protein